MTPPAPLLEPTPGSRGMADALPLSRTPTRTESGTRADRQELQAPDTRQASIHDPLRGRVTLWMQFLHDAITDFFAERDGRGDFREDAWSRPGGGGGISRVLTDGRTFEKVGVNRSVVDGRIPGDLARRLGSRRVETNADVAFFATGVSVVCHPVSPKIPILHMNVRYFELEDADGSPLDCWFGGGLDLTPTYPHPEDAVHFHRALQRTCTRHAPGYYDRFKEWCDRYFVNEHRSRENRGIGGIFFDNLNDADASGLDNEAVFSFVRDVGLSLRTAYGPIVDRRRSEPWGEREKAFQLVRRGRYVEFNLVHDRGTRFGLQTGARIESVLMSLPPLARWGYCLEYEPGSFEDRLESMLEPRDWAAGVPDGID